MVTKTASETPLERVLVNLALVGRATNDAWRVRDADDADSVWSAGHDRPRDLGSERGRVVGVPGYVLPIDA